MTTSARVAWKKKGPPNQRPFPLLRRSKATGVAPGKRNHCPSYSVTPFFVAMKMRRVFAN
jgi:hypothetical protein